MGLDAFTSDGPRTYKAGGKRDPNKGKRHRNVYDSSVYDGIIHIPAGMKVPDKVKELNLEVRRVERLDSTYNDSIFFSTDDDRMATTYEAMVKVDRLKHEDVDGIGDLVNTLIEEAEEYEFVNQVTGGDEQDVEAETVELTEQDDNESEGGISAFM